MSNISAEHRENMLEDIYKHARENEVIFLTIDGPRVANIDKLIEQPTEGVLYDLNRDLATLYTLFKQDGDIHYINDIALVHVFTRILNRLKQNEKQDSES